jgi:hypothetical protein
MLAPRKTGALSKPSSGVVTICDHGHARRAADLRAIPGMPGRGRHSAEQMICVRPRPPGRSARG